MKVNANPTKEFFISMITRDIPLDRAILDLVDNSIDAALSQGDFEGKKIEIVLTDNEFIIKDNCGGMDMDTATNYAFRFGRDPSEQRLTPNSVGQFGVGMKRSLFKLGKKFSVKSFHADGAFKLEVDTVAWVKNEDPNWEFDLEKIDEVNDSDMIISVTSLRSGISERFKSNSFIRDLISEISLAHFSSINNGIQVLVNGKKVDAYKIQLRMSDELGGYYIEDNIDDVKITIRTGVDAQDFSLGGWYIVCNGRLVAHAEQTKKTLWGVTPIPKYHDRFAFFRGVVEFECQDSSKLPWTTTKTSIDTDHPVYRYANKLMVKALQPIIDFLNQRERERKEFIDKRIDDTPLINSIQNSKEVSIYDIDKKDDKFIRPDKNDPKPAEYSSVRYYVEIERLQIVKDSLGVTKNKEAGEESFDYYYDNECK